MDELLGPWDGISVPPEPVIPEPEPEEFDGWTTEELRQFAADHEPPIRIPKGAKRKKILQLILAAIAAEQEEPDEDDDTDDESEPEDAGFDPAEGTVADVQAYLEKNPDQSGFVLDRERAGKNRTTLIGD